MKKQLLTILVSVLLLFFMVACSSENNGNENEQNNNVSTNNTAEENEEATESDEEVEIIISAAASLTDVAEDLKTEFNKEYPHITVNYNFGSSGKLSQQIKEGGAPVDIFMSASVKDMDFLAENDLIVEQSRFDFAGNEVVLIAHESSDIEIDSVEDIVNVDFNHFSFGDIEAMPLGRYGKQAFDALGLWEKVEDRLVFGSTVNQILTHVQQGNAEVGIVFATDAMRGENIKVIAKVDPSLHDEIIYPAAAINTSENLDAANAYLEFLKSEKGKSVLQSHGFITN